MKPLYIPLLRRWFDAFASGEKTEEWRRVGRLWNERRCTVGRPVILALGYASMTAPDHADRRLYACLTGTRLTMPETEEQLKFFGRCECIVLSLADIRR
jgi:hypothetical protein